MTPLLEQLSLLARRELDLGDAPLPANVPFAELGMDSLSLVDFMFTVEDEFHIQIDHARALEQPTLEGLAALVSALLAAQTPLARAA